MEIQGMTIGSTVEDREAQLDPKVGKKVLWATD